jgi:subtilisin family serine protease
MLREEQFNYTSLWINNIIWVHDGTQALAEKIALREDVEKLESNNLVDFDTPVSVSHDEMIPSQIQPNIHWINSPQLWEQNVTGEGIVLGISDTGAGFTHEALIHTYRGALGNNTFDHNYNWYDPARLFLKPVDFNGHGNSYGNTDSKRDSCHGNCSWEEGNRSCTRSQVDCMSRIFNFGRNSNLCAMVISSDKSKG